MNDCNVSPAAGVNTLPLLFERAGETHQAYKGAHRHSNSAERQQGPEPPAPEVLESKSRKRQ